MKTHLRRDFRGKPRRALFITLEGGEGSGKSTQARLLARALRRRGLKVWLTREPGAGKMGKKIRKLLLGAAGAGMPRMCEWLLYEADRAEHADAVRAALKKFDVVVSDRYHDSTVVYQGYGRGIDRRLIAALHRVLLDGVMPDVTFFIDVPVEAGLARARGRNRRAGTTRSEGRFEAEKTAFHRLIRRGYLEQARKHTRRIRVIDGIGSVGEVHRKIMGAIKKYGR